MPEILDRCVAHVMDKGHSESSAYAICRAQIGLMSDGTEDTKPVDMPEEEMRAKVEMALAFQNGMVVRKRMVVAKPIGEFVNGPVKGKITTAILRDLIDNQRKHPRQIKIFLNGDHPKSNDERPADGWAEALSLDADGNLVADSKLLGTAAEWVTNDRIRGASIYATQGKDYRGKPIGMVLKHILLSDEGFMTDLNVAARGRGGEMPVIAFTALKAKEATMAEDKKELDADDKKEVQIKAEPEEVVALKAENIRLQGEILSLNEKLENATVDEEKHELALRVAKLERKTKAQEVREIVFKMLKEGTIDPSWCHGYAKGGDQGTLSWFKASRFKENLELLKWAEENNRPMRTMGKTYQSGAPIDAEENAPTQEDKDLIRSLGKDPDRVIAAMKAKDSAEFAALTAKKE